MVLKLIILSFIITAVALAGLAVRILLVKRGNFPETHIGRNREMRKKGITCAVNIDTGCSKTAGRSGCCECMEE
ncbi:MAG: hypothetical protein HPY62_02095 [Bacteroidales bacterium]|nr:hypothetical protein [Bacteroidales bacterium]